MFGFGKKKTVNQDSMDGAAVKTLRKDDKAGITGDEIRFSVDKRDHVYRVSDVVKIAIYTTDQGPAADDVALLVAMEDGSFILPSEHPLYETFLFDGLSGEFPIDFPKVIEASSCTENAEFILYAKKDSKA